MAGRVTEIVPWLLRGRVVLFGLALLLFCTHSWGTCTTGNYYGGSGYASVDCFNGPSLPNCSSNRDAECFLGDYYSGICLCGTIDAASVCPPVVTNSTGSGYITNPFQLQDMAACNTKDNRSQCRYSVWCSTQAEADSVANSLIPEEDVPSSCVSDYEACVSKGGVWSHGDYSSTECASRCDLCGSQAQVKVLNSMVNICCRKGKAPPDSVRYCYTPPNHAVGMQESIFADNNNSFSCGSLTTSDGQAIQANQALYKRFCLEGDRYEEQVDTNEVGGMSSSEGDGMSSSEGDGMSSSSEGGGASFGNELDALGGLYGVLDTIRDTLARRLTPATEEIRDCLYNFKLCTALEPLQIDWSNMPKDSSLLYVDTAILKYIKPLMDSSVKLDSAQLRMLHSLDTNILKQMQIDSVRLKNDSVTRRAITSGVDALLENDTVTRRAINRVDSAVIRMDSSVTYAVRGVREGVDSFIDSISYYMHGTLDSLSGLGDSLGQIRGILEGALNGSYPTDTNGNSYYGDFVAGSDTMGHGHLQGVITGIIAQAAHDSVYEGLFDTTGIIPPEDSSFRDSFALPSEDSLLAVLDSSVQADKDSLEKYMQDVYDTLKDEIMLIDFDSLILAPLGATVPNTNTCPEHCFTWSLDGEGWVASVGSITLPLCSNLPGQNFNVFLLIRLIGRILTAVGCIYIGIWFIAGKR